MPRRIHFLNTSGDLFLISWTGSASATSYIIQVSEDPTEFDTDPNEAWDTIGETTATSFETTLLVEHIYIRVAGVNTGQGPWAEHDELIEGDTRVTDGTTSEASLTRVTESGDIRVTHLEP